MQKSQIKFVVIISCLTITVLSGLFWYFKTPKPQKKNNLSVLSTSTIQEPKIPELDKPAYDRKLNDIANSSSTTTSTLTNLWPVKTEYPKAGAILPFKRIIAYYGNLYSKNMGVLGEYSEETVLGKLNAETTRWQEADLQTPTVSALHYIAVVAQAGPGRDGKYRARMPDKEIEKVLTMAEKNKSLVFLDIQLGLSDLPTELPLLEKYLQLPQVHLGIDPEFAMHNNERPGEKIGTLDADNINYAADFLAKLVQKNNLPPKILIIHRFTQKMLTNYQNIKPLPEVQVVINMDGFGGQGVKLNTYKQYIYKEPVQFTGFKLFYKNDANGAGGLFKPADLLKLSPVPVYIQYQ